MVINNIPCEDREKLDYLFSKFILNNHFAYTLLGDKAISLAGNVNETPWDIFFKKDGAKRKKICDNWAVWEKYRHLFEIKKYLLLKEQSKKVDKITFFILINKDYFIKTINEYKHVFEKILNKKIDPKLLLEELESGKSTFQSLIKNSETLWGILLGYGEYNSKLYERRDEICHSCKIPFNHLKPSKGFSSIEEEEIYLNQTLQSFDNESQMYIITPINFSSDPYDPERNKKLQHYRELNKKIVENFKGKNLLETTLMLMTEYTIEKSVVPATFDASIADSTKVINK